MNNKRVIIIRNSKSSNFNGNDLFSISLGTGLMKNGYDPIIVSQSEKILSLAREKNIETHRGKWAKRQDWRGFLFPAYLIWQIVLIIWYWKLFVQKKPHIVHIQSRDDFIAATIAGRILRKRVIWTDQEELKDIWDNVDHWFKNPVGKLVRFAAKFAHKITVFSESERSFINEHISAGGVVWQKIKVVYGGVNDVSSEYKNQKNDKLFKFCVASHLNVEKGIGEAINAFGKLSHEYPNTRLIILGSGPDEVIFREEADGNKKVEFLGNQDNILPYIKDADVFIRPTYRDGFSIALIEAGMLSCPIIATAVGGNVEVVKNKETGLLVHPKDALSLYDAMDKLYNDSDLRKKLAHNARQQYEQLFQFNKIVTNEFIPLYEKD